MKTNLNEALIAAAVIVTGLVLASFTIGSTPLPVQTAKNNPETTITKAKTDSILVRFDEKVSTTEIKKSDLKELQKLAEVAYSETDTVLASQIAAEIDQAMKSIDVDKVVKEAMEIAKKAMENASLSIEKSTQNIDKEQIKKDITEAQKDIAKARKEMQEDLRRDLQREGIDEKTIESALKAASAGIEAASSVVESLDIEGIVNSAMRTASEALTRVSEMNLDTIVTTENMDQEQQLKMELEEIKKLKTELEEQKKELRREQRELRKEKQE